jgi:5-methylcytosine-specific restriction endonuclease McrA
MKNYRHSLKDEWKRAKKKTATRVKQVALSTLRRKLDLVFSKWIRKRDALPNGLGRCYTCNRHALLEASHFIPRQHAGTRWDERNVHGACSYCNRWQHGNLYAYGLALMKQYGQATVDELWRSKRKAVKFSRDDLTAMIAKYS